MQGVASPPRTFPGSAPDPGSVRGRGASLLFRAPTLVLVMGFVAAALAVLLGVAELKTQSDEAAELRSEILARTLAARIAATSSDDHALVIERAAQRSGAELLLLDQSGRVVFDATLGVPALDERVSLLVETTGQRTTGIGRARFHVASLPPPREHLSLVAFMPAPERPFATSSLVVSVTTLTILLLAAAAFVSFSFARAVHADVAYVRERIVEMSRSDAHPSGQPIAVRDADQLGILTNAFNLLVERFTAAERAYRQDLTEAVASDRDRSAFLAALSHELRTPLNAVLGFSDVLLSEVDGPLSADARENLTVMRNSGDHLRSLIDDILDLSAMESGEFSLDLGFVDVFAIAAEVVRESRVVVQGKPIVLEMRGQSARAWADPLRVRQIISNVVGNALKFTTKGLISVEVVPTQELAVLEVTDTGPGIPADQQAAIFEEYRQIGGATLGKGTGLGLAITRRLVELHGGTIHLQSEIGTGTRFRIALPTEEGAARVRSLAPNPDSPAARSTETLT